jgi:hypothetical protein
MKKESYYVSICVHGTYGIEVKASSLEEADAKAWAKFDKVELPIDVGDCFTNCIEDPEGKTHYFD